MNSAHAVQPPAGDSPAPDDVWHRGFVRMNRAWCEDFVVELRLVDVPGHVIGDRLAEVESHCVETGQNPEEAFGEAREYARALAVDAPQGDRRDVWRVTALSAVQVIVLLVGTTAFSCWVRGVTLDYNAVQASSLILAVGMVAALPLMLRPIVHHPWTAGVSYLVVFTVLGGAGAFAGGLELPTLVSLPAGATAFSMFAVILLLSVLVYVQHDGQGDRVVSPLPGPSDAVPALHSDRRMAVYLALQFPVIYLLLAGLTLLTS